MAVTPVTYTCHSNSAIFFSLNIALHLPKYVVVVTDVLDMVPSIVV